MAVGKIFKSSGLAATSLSLIGAVGIAAMALPSAAMAEPGEGRGRWQNSEGVQAQAETSERGGWNRGGGDRGGNGNGGGWSQRPQAAPSAPVPVAQSQAAPQQRGWNGGGGGWNGGNGTGGWQARQQATPAPAPVQQPVQQTGLNGGNRGGGGNWQGRTEAAPQAPQAPAPQARGNGGQMGGGNWNSGSNNTGWQGRTSAPQQQQQPNWRGNDNDNRAERARGNDSWRGNNNQRRPDGWRGSDSWRGNDSWRGRDNDRRNDNWRSSSNWRENDRSRDNRGDWNRGWRTDNRYNWNVWRNDHRDIFRLGNYYAPYRGYSYRRLSIGFTLNSLFFGDDYWIDNPWSYRLPEAYGPYRWVRYYDDAVLVNIYTGQVEDVIYDFFW